MWRVITIYDERHFRSIKFNDLMSMKCRERFTRVGPEFNYRNRRLPSGAPPKCFNLKSAERRNFRLETRIAVTRRLVSDRNASARVIGSSNYIIIKTIKFEQTRDGSLNFHIEADCSGFKRLDAAERDTKGGKAAEDDCRGGLGGANVFILQAGGALRWTWKRKIDSRAKKQWKHPRVALADSTWQHSPISIAFKTN